MPTRYHTWDESVLDKPTDFTLQLTLPESAYPTKNADGTDPVVSLKVQSPNLRAALATLGQMRDQNLAAALITSFLIGEDANELADTEENTARVITALTTVHPEFFSLPFSATTDRGEVSLVLTAPSGMIGIQAFNALTSNEKLNGLVASFMPEDDEFYD